MKIGLTFIGLVFSVCLFAQNISRNNAFVELSGVTGIYSVNYERLLRDNKNLNFTFRAGVSYISYNKHYYSNFVFPISFSVLKNISKNHYLEMRLGFANDFYIYNDYTGHALGDTTGTFVPKKILKDNLIPSIGIGYRYQPETKGLFFNFLLQKIVYFSEENWYGNLSLGIGYAF